MMTAVTTIASWKLVILFISVFLAGYFVGTIKLEDDDTNNKES